MRFASLLSTCDMNPGFRRLQMTHYPLGYTSLSSRTHNTTVLIGKVRDDDGSVC